MVAGLPGATPEQRPGDADLAALRAAESAMWPPVPESLDVIDLHVDGVGALHVRRHGTSGGPTLLFLHGGGYIWLSPRTHLPMIAELLAATGGSCLAVDYRRAPEHPFPAAVDDARRAYRWLIESGTDPAEVVLCGDSAGGGLVLATLVALRDAGDPLPAGAMCISPWTDLTVSGASADTADDPVVSGAALRMMASMYLDGGDPRAPTASPLFADLAGLPPLLIQVGTRESLLDDARRMAAAADRAGVDVTLIEHADVVHMWVVFGPTIPESRAAFVACAEFIRVNVGSSEPEDVGEVSGTVAGADAFDDDRRGGR